MASESGFRVLIAGGGVAGLTLANMLERAGIDYNLLEAHGAIAPPVGASIGLFPNGLRVLDQLGVYETIRTAWGHHPMSNCVRTPTGEVVYSSPAMGDHLERRHGYGFIFIDRQRLLQILYDNLRQKDRVRLNTRVVDVEMTDTEVRVTTSGKEQIVGHVLVGADGIHSRVRSEMWRIGTMEIPGSFKKDIQTCKCLLLVSFHCPPANGHKTRHSI
jgi:2-polyprenyl-6-methoxyphenol hydroxylase-like FAD-dependent oxidoreductase